MAKRFFTTAVLTTLMTAASVLTTPAFANNSQRTFEDADLILPETHGTSHKTNILPETPQEKCAVEMIHKLGLSAVNTRDSEYTFISEASLDTQAATVVTESDGSFLVTIKKGKMSQFMTMGKSGEIVVLATTMPNSAAEVVDIARIRARAELMSYGAKDCTPQTIMNTTGPKGHIPSMSEILPPISMSIRSHADLYERKPRPRP